MKCRSATGENYTELMRQQKIIFEQVSPINVLSAREIKSGRLFGNVQYDLKVPEHLKAHFPNFPPTFKNTVVIRNDIGDLVKKYAEKKGIMPQPRRMPISSFQLKNGTIITPFHYITCIWVLKVQKLISS